MRYRKECFENLVQDATLMGDLLKVPTAPIRIMESPTFHEKTTKTSEGTITESWAMKKQFWRNNPVYSWKGTTTYEFHLRVAHELHRIITEIERVPKIAAEATEFPRESYLW